MFEKFAEDVYRRYIEKLAALETTLIDLNKENKHHIKALKSILDNAKEFSTLSFEKDGVPLIGDQKKRYSTKQELQDTLDNEFNRIKLLKDKENNIVGGAVFRKFTKNNDYCISDLSIFPEYRGKGYGKDLLDKILQTKGLNSVSLTVATGNKPAVGLYEEFGFKPYKMEMIRHSN